MTRSAVRPPRRRRGVALAALGVALVGLTGCGGEAPGTRGADAATSPGRALTVLAAASLKEAFTTIAEDFEKANPGTTVTLSFGASPALQTQIEQGAPADVFASASVKNMDVLVGAGLIDGEPVPFARNVLAIAVPPANPAGLTALADLARPGVKVAVCEASVPCGKVAATVLSRAGLTVTPATQEADVKATLAKVQLGEVDAGLVYVTDVRAAGAKVKGIPIPAEVNASTTYPIAALKESDDVALAKAFVAYVATTGLPALAAAGFAGP